MNINTFLFAFALLICKIQAQICGCGPPIFPSSLPTTVISNPQNIISSPPVGTAPVVGTTIIDNSLSNALANVLQLLIVSDLIESTLNTALGLHSVPSVNPTCEPIVTQPFVYTPTIDVITPVADCISPTYPPLIDFVPPCGPFIDFVPPCGPPVFDFVPQCGPVIDYSPSCGPVFDHKPTCGQIIEPFPNFYGGVNEFLTPITNLATIPSPSCCGGLTEFISPVPNNVPMFPQTFNPNGVVGLQECVGSLQMAPLVPNSYNGLPEIIGPFCNIGSLPADILYPSTIPAQLTCNCGSIPTSLPCVSVNVEPCNCGYGNNIMSNPYFY